MTTPIDAPTRENWQELISHSTEIMLDRIEPFQDFLVIWDGRWSYTRQDSGSARRSLLRGSAGQRPPSGAIGAGVYGLPGPES